MERLLRILSSLVLLPQTAMVLLWSHLYALVLRFWDCRVPHFFLGINPWLWEVNPLLFLPIWNFYLCMDILFFFLRRAMWHLVQKNINRMERQILLLETPNTPQNVNWYFCLFLYFIRALWKCDICLGVFSCAYGLIATTEALSPLARQLFFLKIVFGMNCLSLV